MNTEEHRRRSEASFRAHTLRRLPAVVWVLLAAGLGLAAAAGQALNPLLWIPLSAAAVGAVAWSLLGWTVESEKGRVLVGLWALLMIGVIASLALVPGVWMAALLLAVALGSFSALLSPSVGYHGLVIAAACGAVLLGQLFGVAHYGEALMGALGVIVAGGATWIARNEVRFQVRARELLEEELERRDTAFERLLEVTTTLTAGSSLQRVLPELVGRIGRYLRAQVGLMVLHDGVRGVLEVVSPIWTAGYSLEIEGYTLSPNGTGEIEKVFRTGTPALYHELVGDPDAHSVLGELGARNAVCVPLRVDARTIGVLVLADREDGDFDRSDLEALASLAGPAALVVVQMERMEEATETTRRMEDLARMKSDFVSVVSHELRTPLTSIIGSLATLSRPEFRPANDQAAELLVSAREQADRLRRLIEDLLMASRIEHGALPHSPRSIDLERFLNDAVASVPTEERAISIEIRTGAERITADPDHLHRVVINLLDNALKYAPSSPIEIVADTHGAQLTISVIDHGSGIQLAERELAFERFTQLEPAQTRSQGGAGLGLSIVKGLVQAMGGSLDLVETPGGGATFVVGLPPSTPPYSPRAHVEVASSP